MNREEALKWAEATASSIPARDVMEPEDHEAFGILVAEVHRLEVSLSNIMNIYSVQTGQVRKLQEYTDTQNRLIGSMAVAKTQQLAKHITIKELTERAETAEQEVQRLQDMIGASGRELYIRAEDAEKEVAQVMSDYQDLGARYAELQNKLEAAEAEVRRLQEERD